MSETSVKITGDFSGLKAASDQAANAVRDATRRMQDGFSAVGDAVRSNVDGWAGRFDALNSRLDQAGRYAGVASTALDAMGQTPASAAVAQFAGRLDELNGVVQVAGGGVHLLADALRSEGADASHAAELMEQYRAAVDDVTAANDNGHSTWLDFAVGVGAGVVVIGGASLAVYGFASAIQRANDAVVDWLGSISGFAAAQGAFSAPARAAYEAQADLNRQIGIGVENMAQLGAVARDYGVSQDQATATMEHLVAVLSEDNSQTHAAREALESYIGSLSGLTGSDWASVLDRYAQAMNSYADSIRKTADAQLILGQSATTWLRGIANGAGDISHATTEIDKMEAYINQRIAESNRLIAQMKPDENAWTRFVDLFDRMTSRSEDFKEKQKVVWTDFETRMNEVNASNVGWLDKISQRWDLIKKTASDYVSMLGGTYVPPLPSSDNRPEAPGGVKTAPKMDAGASASREISDLQAELQQKELLQENWLRKDHQLEVDFWAQKKALYEQEFGESMTKEEVAKNATIRAITEKYQMALRSQAQYQDQQRQQSETAADQEHQQELTGQLRLLQQQTSAAKQGTQDRIAAAQAEVTFAEANWGKLSSQYKSALDRMLQAQREYTQQQQEIRKASVETDTQIAQIQLQTTKDHLDAEVAAGRLTELQKIQALKDLTAAANGENVKRLEDERASLDQGSKAWEDVNNRIRILQAQQQSDAAKTADQIGAVQRRAAQQTSQAWENAFAPVERAYDSMLSGMMQGTQSFAQVRQRAAANILASEISADTKWLLHRLVTDKAVLASEKASASGGLLAWLLSDRTKTVSSTASETARTSATKAGATARTVANAGEQTSFLGRIGTMLAEWLGLETEKTAATAAESGTRATEETAAGTAAIIAAKAQAAAEIPSYAGIGAAAAMASVAAIPLIGWAMAPEVGAEHFAEAISYLGMASAAGGWDRVPDDGAFAELHKDEMVLPASIANPLRGLTSWLPSALAQPQVNGSLGASGSFGTGSSTYSPTLTINAHSHGQAMSADEIARLATQALRNGHRDFIRQLRKTV